MTVNGEREPVPCAMATTFGLPHEPHWYGLLLDFECPGWGDTEGDGCRGTSG